MAFIKTGDPIPISGFYNDDMELKVCPKCGSPKTLVILDDGENKIACDCDAEKDDESSPENK